MHWFVVQCILDGQMAWTDGPIGAALWQSQATGARPVQTGISGWQPEATARPLQ